MHSAQKIAADRITPPWRSARLKRFEKIEEISRKGFRRGPASEGHRQGGGAWCCHLKHAKGIGENRQVSGGGQSRLLRKLLSFARATCFASSLPPRPKSTT